MMLIVMGYVSKIFKSLRVDLSTKQVIEEHITVSTLPR